MTSQHSAVCVTSRIHLGYCSASGGSFWDRPAGCAWLFWIQSGRGLDCSTSMPRGGLDLSQQSPNRRKVGLWNSLVGGRRYVTLAKWVTEVGHWPPSSLGNFSVIKETYFCGANCVALLQCELFLRQLHLHKIHKSTDNSNWRIGSYSHFRDMSCQKTFVTFAPTATDAPNCQALFWNVVPPYPPEQALIYHQSPLEQSNWRVVKYVLKILVVNDTYMSIMAKFFLYIIIIRIMLVR